MTDSLHQQIDKVGNAFQKDLHSGKDPESLQVAYLGRKGHLTQILRGLGGLPEKERQEIGALANKLKLEIVALLEIEQKPETLIRVDRTLPAFPSPIGSRHPISVMIEEMTDIFRDLSFEVVEGREIVSDLENFENLNMSLDHPSRDSQDTFFLNDKWLLRTQTTSIQVLEMARRLKSGQLPIRIVMPGKVYRRESDPTHSPMFYQMDAVLVDQQTTLSDLKGTLQYFVQRLHGPQTKTRFRPHYFPYTEPSAEIDILWVNPRTGVEQWLEIGGCGMIHPAVLARTGIDPKQYQGWAFGLGVERQFMIRHQVPDIRLLYANNSRLLDQFNFFV